MQRLKADPEKAHLVLTLAEVTSNSNSQKHSYLLCGNWCDNQTNQFTHTCSLDSDYVFPLHVPQPCPSGSWTQHGLDVSSSHRPGSNGGSLTDLCRSADGIQSGVTEQGWWALKTRPAVLEHNLSVLESF